jgi:hypothetical protein
VNGDRNAAVFQDRFRFLAAFEQCVAEHGLESATLERVAD